MRIFFTLFLALLWSGSVPAEKKVPVAAPGAGNVIPAGQPQVAVPQTPVLVADDDDDEYEEIVIRRKKKKKQVAVAPAVAPVNPQPVVGVPAVQPVQQVPPAVKEPAPPPEPPAEDAAEPRRLVRYFCKAWKNEDWKRMWWAMEPSYRKKVNLKKFTKLFKDDAESNGGLLDENIVALVQSGTGEGVKVELIFKFPRAKHRFTVAIVRRGPGGQYRIVPSSIIPIDFDDL